MVYGLMTALEPIVNSRGGIYDKGYVVDELPLGDAMAPR
jgi:hypothetical protein